ncbi:hypothetical protein DV515_00017851 [Chloebia gouldiae]|uniref:Uncharacterized protein n=1 Tax=Chloebia gouldiae TaxID=44316 RepID=A0A3L8Q9F4_CHLGU|nr:hypothetical protein DV515_00017851 [Chloebia gouldiae]
MLGAPRAPQPWEGSTRSAAHTHSPPPALAPMWGLAGIPTEDGNFAFLSPSERESTDLAAKRMDKWLRNSAVLQPRAVPRDCRALISEASQAHKEERVSGISGRHFRQAFRAGISGRDFRQAFLRPRAVAEAIPPRC